MTGQCCFRYAGNCWTVIPSTPALPLLALTRANARLQFSRPQTSSINCSPMAGLSVPRFTASDSVPPPRPFGASPLYSSAEANISWFFCRLSLMSRAAYLPLPSTPYGDRSGLCSFPLSRAIVTHTPSADFCRPVRTGCPILSPVSRTNGRSPEVSSTAFRTQPPDLQPVPLMDMDFVVIGQLVRHRMPHIRSFVHRLVRLLHASSRPRLATTPLRFAMTSPPSGCQKDFHLRAVEHARHTDRNDRRSTERRS